MDCTYKTNKYKMPLLDIVGITSLNTSFYVGFCFVQVAKEDFNHYEFALRCLDEIYSGLDLAHPRTIITDKDDALHLAIRAVFPTTDCIVCVWHIMTNILKTARPLFRHELRGQEELSGEEYKKELDEKWQAMLKMWNDVVRSSRQRFQTYYSANLYSDLLRYIESEWLCWDEGAICPRLG